MRSPNHLRVLWAIKQLGSGGSERLLASAARHHDRSRFEIHTVYALRGNDELAPQLTEAGVTVHCLDVSDGLDPRWVIRFQRLLAHGGFDIVHIHSPLMAGFIRPVLATIPRQVRPGLVITEHGAWQHYHLLTRALNRVTLPIGDARVAVSEEAKRSLPAQLRRTARVVTQAVPVDELVPLRGERGDVRAELGIADDELVILTVANLRPVKDYPNLLAAARIVLDRLPNVRFLAVGGGRLEDQLHTMQRTLRLGHRFQLLGLRSDATRLMAGADLFVLPSRDEGYPVAVMEAMALGLPVVATGVGGVPEAVRDGVDGLIVPTARPEALAEAIIRLARDPDLRAEMARASGARGSSYDVGATTRMMEMVYEGVAARRATAASMRSPWLGSRSHRAAPVSGWVPRRDAVRPDRADHPGSETDEMIEPR